MGMEVNLFIFKLHPAEYYNFDEKFKSVTLLSPSSNTPCRVYGYGVSNFMHILKLKMFYGLNSSIPKLLNYQKRIQLQ